MTTIHDQRLHLDILRRRDLLSFTHACFQTVVPGQRFSSNWHLEAIAYQLERCRRREIRRLIITLPPRSLKSICASVAFPAFLLGHDPSTRIVCVSYSQELTGKHARDSRNVMESAWYRRLFPRTRIDPRKNAEAEFETTARGYRLGTSVGGTLTGRGGNFVIIDDPLKPADAMSEVKRAAANEWYDSTLTSRLDQKTEDVIVVIMQRLHVDDLVGHLLDRGEDWTHLNLPAIADAAERIQIGEGRFHRRRPGELLHPAREPMSILEEQRLTMGSLGFSAQYQQAPVPPGGALLQEAWFGRRYTQQPELQRGDRIVQSWDTASKASKTNDYSVCTTWLMRGRDYYLLHVLRKKLEYPALRRQVLAHAEAWNTTTVLIEDASSGASLSQDLRHEGPFRPISIRPEADKIVRLEGQSAVVEAGHVILPEEASWLGDFLVEILSFPNGRHDDQVDSFSQFLAWAAKQHWRRDTPSCPPVLITADGPIRYWDDDF